MKEKQTNQDLGIWGENKAAEYFMKKDYAVLEHGFRTRAGEIDLILWEPSDNGEISSRTLVFVEVKTRLSFQFGAPSLAVTPTKQHHLLLAARYYAHLHHLEECPMRYDVVEIVKLQDKSYIHHIKNAFS